MSYAALPTSPSHDDPPRPPKERSRLPRLILGAIFLVALVSFLASFGGRTTGAVEEGRDEVVEGVRQGEVLWKGAEESGEAKGEEELEVELELAGYGDGEGMGEEEKGMSEEDEERLEEAEQEDGGEGESVAEGGQGRPLVVLCTEEVLQRRHEASFWRVEQRTPLRYIISPTSSTPLSHPPCLAHAIFTVRLLSSLKDPATLFLLPSPPTLVPFAGAYEFTVPQDLAIPRKRYFLDVRLEFGDLEGAREGMVCGAESTGCDPVALSAELGEEIGYSGGRVEVVSGAEIEVGTVDVEASPPPPCTTFSPFTGYWNDQSFYPNPSSSPCSLLTPSIETTPPPFPPPSLSPSSASVTWIHLVGDSNTRNLFHRLHPTFGIGPSRQIKGRQSSSRKAKKMTVSAIAFRSRSGKYVAGGEGTIIVTYQWWYQPMTVATARTGAEHLMRRVDATLGEWVTATGLDVDLASMEDVRATRTYVSLGSHAEQLSALGMERSLDVLLGPAGLSSEVMERAGVRVWTTTSVQAGMIPRKFGHQELLRNNAVIRARNQVLAGRRELRGRVVELGGLFETVTELFMRDAVHAQPTVYVQWARIVWTEMMREKEVEGGMVLA